MKKIYISLSIIAMTALGNQATAQSTTITTAAMPQVGYTYNLMSDTLVTDMANFSVSAGSASAQTWNYTTQWGTTYPDPLAFVSKASGTGASNFTNANMASNVNGTWVYWVSGTSGLYIDGYYATIQGSPTAINFAPDPVQFPVPYTYTSSPVVSSYLATFTLTVSGFPATVKHRGVRTTSADAFGSVTTPSGTYPNTLRIKTHETTSDSAFVFGSFAQAQYDTTTSYDWLQNSADAAVLSISLNKSGAVTKAQYLQSFTNGIQTVSQHNDVAHLYPNPVSDVAYFTYENKTSGKVTLQLIDATGKQVAVLVNETQSVGTQHLALDIKAMQLTKGLYFLQLSNGSAVQTIKLSVN